MSHIFTQFIAPTHLSPRAYTIQEVELQSEQVWDTVAFTTTLDAIVGVDAVLEHIDSFLTAHNFTRCVCILEEYMLARFPALAHEVSECGAPVQFCLQ
jgi:hypothetical protein